MFLYARRRWWYGLPQSLTRWICGIILVINIIISSYWQDRRQTSLMHLLFGKCMRLSWPFDNAVNVFSIIIVSGTSLFPTFHACPWYFLPVLIHLSFNFFLLIHHLPILQLSLRIFYFVFIKVSLVLCLFYLYFTYF